LFLIRDRPTDAVLFLVMSSILPTIPTDHALYNPRTGNKNLTGAQAEVSELFIFHNSVLLIFKQLVDDSYPPYREQEIR
jgi:hypothetical protein